MSKEEIEQIKKMAMQADLVPSEVVLKLLEENARYREALEYYANRMGMGGTARKALKGE